MDYFSELENQSIGKNKRYLVEEILLLGPKNQSNIDTCNASIYHACSLHGLLSTINRKLQFVVGKLSGEVAEWLKALPC